ncbi:hypothetical protein [Campylobacter jejuni]|uniref:hypothetical protein n=1 Tax=Campylobacter jejuni TaxID=197 RepID=UPI0007749CDD|nr:hypothetical protein [Campylobacter jejuni]EAH4640033.1 hypothetical protein [Campylobacter jejuni]EAH5332498.1 hypothetical protein [Campylobacter jejuni]EAH7148448.1 hypothetical protein [Campylobacter jejuni]EAH9306692.1 hypothetical protein [Campylobacter jejuni]EAJ0168185.1 hypothetical protein [Campylobacter jejuni]
MANNDLRAGSGPANSAIGAAEAYHNGVLKQQALMNSMFDKFASFVKEQRNEKREDKVDLQKEQIHSLQKESMQKQNELLAKNLAHFEKDKEQERARNKAQNAAAYASAGVHNEQQRALRMQRKEKEDFDKLSKRLNPLNYSQSGFSNIDDTDIQNALSFSENGLFPQRR